MERGLAFLKRHGFVIAGVGLPLLVVAALALARALPRVWVDDPRYELVYVLRGDYGGPPTKLVCDVASVEGRVRVRWVRVEIDQYEGVPRVFRLDPARGEPIELALPPPGDLPAVGDSSEAFVEGLDDVRLRTTEVAPDGYTFESNWRSGGLFGDLFGRTHAPRTSVHKDGRRIAVPVPPRGAYAPAPTLLGWCLPIEGC